MVLKQGLGFESYQPHSMQVFQLKSENGTPKYSVLPLVVKSGLVLAQTNDESERSLSINSGIVKKERDSLGETTIVGLRTVKDAVKFFDPENQRPENILITKDLKLSVKCAHTKYLERLEKDKIEFEKKKEEARLKREAEERKERENAKLLESKKCLGKDEEELEKNEQAARQTLAAADELLSEATSKLQNAVTESSVNKQPVQVASMMLETAKSKREKAMENLDGIREQRKKLESKTRKLLDKAIPSSSSTTTSKRSGSHEKHEGSGCKKAKMS